MKTLDTFAIALRNLWRRKLRAFLTVLGMVIGVSAIVVMVSLGIGINEYFTEMYQEGGDLTTIRVNRWRRTTDSEGNMMYSNGDDIVLDDRTVEQLRQLPGIEAVMPTVWFNFYVKSGQYQADFYGYAVDLEAAAAFGYAPDEGRLPEPHSGSTYEVTIPYWSLQNFYNQRTGKQALDSEGNPRLNMDSRYQMTMDWSNLYDDGGMGYEGEQQQRAKGRWYKLRVVGTYAQENYNMYYSIIDINALKKLAKENKDFISQSVDQYEEVLVKCKNMDDVIGIQQQIMDMGYGAESQQEWLKQATDSMASLQMLLGAIGGVALLVAAIGIMNTMMMSIYERTKEIGIIKVLGCRMSNIAMQFLAEAAYIGLFGGALGLGVSYGLSFILNTFVFANDTSGGIGAMMRSSIPLYLALGGVVFSIAVAIVSGMYPALRAMRLSALTAIRNE